MDMSKLPRLSQRPNDPAPQMQTAPPQTAPPQPQPQAVPTPAPSAIPVADRAQNAPALLAEAWISIAIGLLLLLVVPHTLQYASSKVFHTTFAPFADPNLPYPAKCDFIQYTDGTRIYYRDLPNFWSDLAVTGFALALLLDGAVLLLARRRALVGVALTVTLLATAGNLLWLVGSYSSYGLALLSALAVIFGGYIAFYQWTLLVALTSRDKTR